LASPKARRSSWSSSRFTIVRTPRCMSHAEPSCAGFAPRHSTFGVTTQKFGMGEPRSFVHTEGAAGIDEDGKPARSTNRNAALQVLELAMSVAGLRRDQFHLTVLVGQLQGSRRASRQHLNVGRIGFAAENQARAVLRGRELHVG